MELSDNKITENFYWSEFFKSQIAKRLNINNVPESNVIFTNIQELTENILQPLRDKFGPIFITSGYRSPELNEKIGGSPYSNHCKGCAADIESSGDIKLIAILEWIHRNCEYRELIAEYFPNGWVHVAYRKCDNNYQLKLKDSNHHYKVVSLDYIKSIY